MRTSSYVIYVDLPDQADRCLLTHGYTGAYDVVSRPVAGIGKGYSLTGHHEIMIPLLAAARLLPPTSDKPCGIAQSLCHRDRAGMRCCKSRHHAQ